MHKQLEKDILDVGKPADYSFMKIKTINVEKFLDDIGLEAVRYTRVKGVPERGKQSKFLTKSLWLNNNKIKSIENTDLLVDAILEYPDQLSWLDFSFNYIAEIHDCILKFKNLKILYFHGNCISDMNQIFKLRSLKLLRSLTFHGNPISNNENYRIYVISVLPQIVNLDFTPIVPGEKMVPPPSEALKKLKEDKKAEKAGKSKE